MTYDEDGNLTHMPASSGITATGGNMHLTWNAENRLIAVAPQTPTDGDTRVEFLYDYMGRRVQKTAFTYAGDTWSQSSEARFVYDGWNLIEEITIAGNISGDTETRCYFVWGLDLSQSLQGAGGVGGLLAAIAIDDATPEPFLYCYDANGNVGQMINAVTGEIAARYEYDPFGNLTRSTGDMAEGNPFRFSTKYHDNKTGLYYYGYRYYVPEIGRWLSRDPIEEDGGYNLYNFVYNNSLTRTNHLGLWFWPEYKNCGRYSVNYSHHYREKLLLEMEIRILEKQWREKYKTNFRTENAKLEIRKFQHKINLLQTGVRRHYFAMKDSMAEYNRCTPCSEGFYCRYGSFAIDAGLAISSIAFAPTGVGVPVIWSLATVNNLLTVMVCDTFTSAAAAESLNTVSALAKV